MKNNCRTFFGFFVSVCNQPCGAPFMDKGWTRETVGKHREGPCLVFLLSFQKNSYKEFIGGNALVLGRWSKNNGKKSFNEVSRPKR